MPNVKVIIHDGVVVDALSDDKSVNVEIIDVNENYEDVDRIREYENELYHDPSYQSVPHTMALFKED